MVYTARKEDAALREFSVSASCRKSYLISLRSTNLRCEMQLLTIEISGHKLTSCVNAGNKKHDTLAFFRAELFTCDLNRDLMSVPVRISSAHPPSSGRTVGDIVDMTPITMLRQFINAVNLNTLHSIGIQAIFATLASARLECINAADNPMFISINQYGVSNLSMQLLNDFLCSFQRGNVICHLVAKFLRTRSSLLCPSRSHKSSLQHVILRAQHQHGVVSCAGRSIRRANRRQRAENALQYPVLGTTLGSRPHLILPTPGSDSRKHDVEQRIAIVMQTDSKQSLVPSRHIPHLTAHGREKANSCGLTVQITQTHTQETLTSLRLRHIQRGTNFRNWHTSTLKGESNDCNVRFQHLTPARSAHTIRE